MNSHATGQPEILPAVERALALAPSVPAVISPMDMINRAVEQGAGIETLEKLMALQERWEKNQARKAFDNAMAAAKAEIPVILKNREVDFTSPKGRTNYQYEDLAGIAAQIDPILAKQGLSYRFRTQNGPNEPVTVTCVVSHRDGHSEENTLSGGKDDSGNKNPLQQVGSTITYLQRYTLKAALGLAASKDDDGRAAPDTGEVINLEQLEILRGLIESTGSDIALFCKLFKIDALPDMQARDFERAVALLKKKAARK